MKKLVSVLTPAYNSGKFINRLLDSILRQTYPTIEMYVIDDGSKDDTASVVKSYIPKFEEKGYSLQYIYQENSGQSVAINNGLKLVKGDYLVWPDSDDYFATNDAIEKMVNRLEKASPEFAMVRVQERLIEENTGKTICIKGLYANEEEPLSLFHDCVMGVMYFMPGGYMIRFKTFVEENGLDIYTEKDAGQNWQMFMPILYRHRCITIKEPLYNVVIRAASHSRGQYEGFKRNIVKVEAYERTVLNTFDNIKAMPQDECLKYKREVKHQYAVRKFKMAVDAGLGGEVDNYYNQLQREFGVTFRQKVLRLMGHNKVLKTLMYGIVTPIENFKKRVKGIKPL